MIVNKKIPKDVLIIDDDKEICEILAAYCLNMGCFKNIICANDGLMATMKLRNQKFALILLDMNMPKKSGLDLLSEFDRISLNQKEHILVISGTLEKELIGKIISRGVNSFLVKPFDEPAFQEKVLKILCIPSSNAKTG